MDTNEQKAWEQWFEQCALKRCELPLRFLLKNKILSSITARMNRLKISKTTVTSEEMLVFFDSWFCQRKKGDSEVSLKPYKQFILERAKRNGDTLEKTVYSCILGKELYTLSRKLIEDSQGHYDSRLSQLDEEAHIKAAPTKEMLLNDEVAWVVQTVADTFMKYSHNPKQDYERLNTYLDPNEDYQTADVSKSTFYEQRKKAERTLFEAICANSETKLICSVYGTTLIPMILKTIHYRLKEA